MKFFVTGSAGLIGSQITKDLLNQNHDVYSCYHNSEPEYGIPVKLDLVNPSRIENILLQIKPDRIIHLAALTNVDECEKQKDLAMKLNAKATEILAKQASKNQIFFVYVSTDYVFDGIEGMKKEVDNPKPIGFYGKSKLAGETSLKNLALHYSIARTSTPFGWHKTKKSFPVWVIENLEAKKEIPVLVDQFTSPTYVPNLSKMLIEIALRQIPGIIHLAGADRISRFEFAEMIAEKFSLDKNLLIPQKTESMNWIAPRPLDSSLDVSLANKILNEKPLSTNESIDLFFSERK